MQRRVTGQAPQFDEFAVLKMALGRSWDMNGGLAWVIPTPPQGKTMQARDSVVILRATHAGNFISRLKNGVIKNGITPGRIEGSPAFMATRGRWVLMSASRSTLRNYLTAKSGLKLSSAMQAAFNSSDLTIEGETTAVRKVFQELVAPSVGMMLSAMPGHPLPIGNPALSKIMHQAGRKMLQQLNTSLQLSMLTVHFGRQAVVVNLAGRFKAGTAAARLIQAQPAISPLVLAGLPNRRYWGIYADSINGAALAEFLRSTLPAAAHGAAASNTKTLLKNRSIRAFLNALAGHTGSGTVLLMAHHQSLSAGEVLTNPWDSGPAVIILYARNAQAQLHNLATLFRRHPFAASAAAAHTVRHTVTVSHVNVQGMTAMLLALPSAGRSQKAHQINLIELDGHRVLVCIDAAPTLLHAAIAAAGAKIPALAKRPGLAQTIGNVVPGTFVVAYLPFARWNTLQNTPAGPKAANALTLGLPPPPAVFSIGAGKQSLNMQLYIPMATLEQSLAGNSAGTLF
jgi:hypothetical protein